MVLPSLSKQQSRRSANKISVKPATTPSRKVSASTKSSSSSPKKIASTGKSSSSTRKAPAGLVVLNAEKGKLSEIRRSSSASAKSSSSSGSSSKQRNVATPTSTPSRKTTATYTPPPNFTATTSNSKEVASDDKEVDFFANPTILSRLIQNHKFAAAISRLEKQGPNEAAIWVCTKRKLPAALQFAEAKNVSAATRSQSSGSSSGSGKGKAAGSSDNGSNYTFRQLPIHMACGSLFRVEDQALRRDLEQLIARLVIAYPEGCSRRDHQGRFPLHECIWYSAAPPIISALLMAAPDIAKIADMQGVTPSVLNEHRKCPIPAHKKMVRGMLKKSPEFWHTARKEAELRMKHRDIPASDATITSTSVLASSETDEETILSNERKQKRSSPPTQTARQQLQQQPRSLPKHQQAPPTTRVQAPPPIPQQIHQQQQNEESVIKPMAWAQLEKRALALEQKLAESYEHIYVLNQQLNELKGAKTALQSKVDRFQNTDLGKRVVELEHQKDELQFHLARSQAVLAKHGISLEEENFAEDMPPLPPLQISYSTEETAETTSDEDEIIEEIIEDDEEIIEEIIEEEAEEEERYEGSAKQLSQEQQKLALLKEQLETLTNDHLDYQDRVQTNYEQLPPPQNLAYSGDVIFDNDEDQSTRSELTMDFTTITPAARFRPERPEPDGNNSLIGGPPRMSQVVEESDIGSERSPSVMEDDEVGPLPVMDHDNRTFNGQNSLLGDQSAFELDSIIAGAMQLNDGQGLSPELIAMWRATSVGSTGASMNELAERYMEECSAMESYAETPPASRRPAADNASLV
eukprot:CAMPEP_0172448268 /NCGR_PEP_ID=MMETSP1065-20121228/7314_1 /TAXON_ID=265537 /ORGANISM="Amphiprora paludosa, Strain CCMP125" /LENGTH=805 /DNA_ID=CAMNT_0013199711 /DNA_START=38 /DNA_END=2455 /DNA_ORIENTATION=+